MSSTERQPLAQAEYPSLPEPAPAAPLPAEPAVVAPMPAAPAQPPRKLDPFEQAMVRNDGFPAKCEGQPHMMVLNGVLFFDALPALADVKALLREEMLHYVRFRSKLLNDGSVEPCEVDLDSHVRVLEDPDVLAGTVEAAIERVARTDLAADRPQWEVLLVPHKPPFAVTRVHHAVGDGFALSSVFERLLKTQTGAPIPPFAGGTKSKAPEPKAPGLGAKCARGMTKCCRGVAIGCDAVASFVKTAMVPKQAFETDQAFSPVPQKHDLVYSGNRKVMMFPRTKLSFVKDLKTAAHCSVNDVLMACFGGAVREYCLEMEADSEFARSKAPVLRALVPFGMPLPGQDADALRNNFAFLSAPLPVGPPDTRSPFGPTQARVLQTQKAMNKFKRSTMPAVALYMVNHIANKLPTSEQQKTALGLFGKHSVVYSNVPGPQDRVYFAGQAVSAIQCIFFNHIPQVILISYAGEVGLSLTFDPDVVTRPERFVELYTEQFRKLAAELGLSADGVFSPAL